MILDSNPPAVVFWVYWVVGLTRPFSKRLAQRTGDADTALFEFQLRSRRVHTHLRAAVNSGSLAAGHLADLLAGCLGVAEALQFAAYLLPSHFQAQP